VFSQTLRSYDNLALKRCHVYLRETPGAGASPSDRDYNLAKIKAPRGGQI